MSRRTDQPQYVKVSGAARYLGLAGNTVRRYTDSGLIRAKRLPGGDRIYKREWLDEFVESLEDAVEPPKPLAPSGPRAYNPSPSDPSSNPREGGK